MSKIEREDIQLLSQHSNLSEASIDRMLKKEVYSTKESWQRFLRLFFISLGVGFTTAGILFFFAYNWADLHKFAKIGLIEGLVILLTLLAVNSKVSLDIKNVLLTGASILVGVLFAVFGQIYQTGANAYDFFLGWTMAITIWVIIANFAPLWTIFILLINTTLYFYSEQVAQGWSETFLFTLLFLVNVLFLAASLFVSRLNPEFKPPAWFINLLALAAVSISTVGIIIAIEDSGRDTFFLPLFIITAAVFATGIAYAFKKKRVFYLSIIPFSVILIISAFIIEQSNDMTSTLLFLSLFLLGSVTLTIKMIISLQKKWISQ